MRVLIIVTALFTISQAKEQSEQIQLKQAIQASVGLALLILSVIIYIINNRSRQIVQFQHFQISNPSTPYPVINETKDQKSTNAASLKEVSFESAETSPAEKKKRKRKAHRLSDRRKNNEQNIDSEEVEQNSQI